MKHKERLGRAICEVCNTRECATEAEKGEPHSERKPTEYNIEELDPDNTQAANPPKEEKPQKFLAEWKIDPHMSANFAFRAANNNQKGPTLRQVIARTTILNECGTVLEWRRPMEGMKKEERTQPLVDFSAVNYDYSQASFLPKLRKLSGQGDEHRITTILHWDPEIKRFHRVNFGRNTSRCRTGQTIREYTQTRGSILQMTIAIEFDEYSKVKIAEYSARQPKPMTQTRTKPTGDLLRRTQLATQAYLNTFLTKKQRTLQHQLTAVLPCQSGTGVKQNQERRDYPSKKSAT